MGEPINLLVEGTTDEPALTRIVSDSGREILAVYGRHGKSWIDMNLGKYNQAARYGKWLAVRDLDTDASCAAQLVARLLPQPSPQMHLRIAVHQLEAWLLGDRNGSSEFFGLRLSTIPREPENVINPKAMLVTLCRSSRFRRIREGMVPGVGSTAKVGPEYVGLITEFCTGRWNWRQAAEVVRQPQAVGWCSPTSLISLLPE